LGNYKAPQQAKKQNKTKLPRQGKSTTLAGKKPAQMGIEQLIRQKNCPNGMHSLAGSLALGRGLRILAKIAQAVNSRIPGRQKNLSLKKFLGISERLDRVHTLAGSVVNIGRGSHSEMGVG
jgi:hypothetical protein